MSNNPNDLTALTPGHFLIGEPLINMVDPSAVPLKGNLLHRWKLITHLKNEFWRRWSTEYLSQLQYRYKWRQKCQNVKSGDMVLVKEDNTPTLKWPLGRIINTIKGDDGLVRVADVRTSSGALRRPIHKLAPLPVESEDDPRSLVSYEDLEADKFGTRSHKTSQAKSYDQSKLKRCKESASTSTKDEPTNDPVKKKQRMSPGEALVTLLASSLFIPSTHSSPIETRALNQTGIYFESLGTANLVADEWNLVIFYDMSPYWKEYEFLKNCTQKLHLLCGKLVQRGISKGIINHLEKQQSQLSENNLLITTYHATTKVKRGALNIVGNIANAFFGVLDSEYANRMSQTINGLQNNEIHLQELIKNQTSVIDATLNIISKEEDYINQQFQLLEQHIAQTDD